MEHPHTSAKVGRVIQHLRYIGVTDEQTRGIKDAINNGEDFDKMPDWIQLVVLQAEEYMKSNGLWKASWDEYDRRRGWS